MMDEQSLIVELYGERIGELRRRPGGGAFFYGDSTWVANQFHPILGLSWLLRPHPMGQRSSNMYLPAWFENLLPERDTKLRTRIADAIGIHPKKSFTLLSRLGMDLPGAVVIRSNTTSIDEDVETDEVVQDAEESAPNADDSFHFSSLAGVQLKFSVSLRDQKVTLPIKGEDGSWILKLTTGDYPDLAMVEYVTMQWAKAIGFDVPEHRVIRLREVKQLEHLANTDEELAFLIRRFDRADTGRIHQEDFAQVFDYLPEDKYAELEKGQVNHDGMARMVLDACGEDELFEYIRRLAFVIASGNTDAHLKNWSLLHPREERPRLTPLYDQVCTIAWPKMGWNKDVRAPRLSLGLSGSKKFAELNRTSFHKLAQRVGLSEKQVDDIIAETIQKSLAYWPQFEAIAPAHMRDAITIHTKKVPLLKSFAA